MAKKARIHRQKGNNSRFIFTKSVKPGTPVQNHQHFLSFSPHPPRPNARATFSKKARMCNQKVRTSPPYIMNINSESFSLLFYYKQRNKTLYDTKMIQINTFIQKHLTF
ncbi:hypothetical protein [Fibrobacter succinogenes]|uniref:hypothetical protein n=1 Tax=Fibrobacter succinogenes TaxID=833 RepID=UPI001B7FB750|nr:hypothetical protein [Fibrobacter succinogenes]